MTKTLDASRQTDNHPFVSISDIRAVYNVPVGTAAQSPKTNQLAVEFTPTGLPFYSDTQKFCQMSNEVFTNFSKIMGPIDERADGHSSLDVEMLTGLGTRGELVTQLHDFADHWTVSNWYLAIDGAWIYEMALELFAMKEAPQVVSISYGWSELNSCDSSVSDTSCDGLTVAQWINRTNIELIKVGLRRKFYFVVTLAPIIDM